MPRPTAAQLAYGLATVVFSTLAMLLLSQTRSAVGVTVVACSGLALGLLVAMTVPLPKAARATRSARTGSTPRTAGARREVPVRTGTEQRRRAGAPSRADAHSLRR